MTDLIDFSNTISLMRHKTYSVRSPPIPRLTVLYCKMKFLHTLESVWDQLRLNHQSPPQKHGIFSVILFGDNALQSDQFWWSLRKRSILNLSCDFSFSYFKMSQNHLYLLSESKNDDSSNSTVGSNKWIPWICGTIVQKLSVPTQSKRKTSDT